jgi:uncharacterized protein
MRLPPLANELLLVGFPVISTFVESSEPDGTLFAYLELVGSDGSLTYLTEGLIRLGSRGPVQPAVRTDQRLARSFAAKDFSPMQPGIAAPVVFELQPLSVKLPVGAVLQLSFASSDTHRVVGA